MQPDGNAKLPAVDAQVAKPAPPANATANAPSSGGSSAQQTATPAAAPSPGDTTASPAANVITAHLDTAATSAPSPASSNAQTATNTVKAAAANLPNFGLLATNSATLQNAAAASTTASAAQVSVAGLPIAIAARAQAGSNQFDIRLDPPELGRIDVRLDVDSNGQVTSHVTVERPETLTLLQSQQPQLERALQQAGLKTADNGLQFSLRDQSFAGQNGANGGGTQPNSAQQLVVPDPSLSPVETTQIYSRINLGGGIDIRV